MKKIKLAVIQFPGSNCEYETARAAQIYGFDAQIVRWATSAAELDQFTAYILPGGFSYQDRIRAGIIASKLPLLKVLQTEAEKGKLILGICNGCQILAEAGFFPNLDNTFQLETALAPNTQDKIPVGFICNWVYVKITNPQNSPFTQSFFADEILPIQINHGEGRFVLSELAKKKLAGLTHLQYCDAQGKILDKIPVNLNGSFANLAGIANPKGNILALMPHPERAAFLKQVPTFLDSEWSDKKRQIASAKNLDGPWARMFISMLDYLKQQAKG